jgi:hypothetical protein
VAEARLPLPGGGPLQRHETERPRTRAPRGATPDAPPPEDRPAFRALASAPPARRRPSRLPAPVVVQFNNPMLTSSAFLNAAKRDVLCPSRRQEARVITLTPEQQQHVARQLQGLADHWKATTRYRSNTNALRNHPVYRELVALGEAVVPLILVELERDSNVSWFTVLATITGENPVPTAVAGQVDAMAQASLDWGRQRGDAV